MPRSDSDIKWIEALRLGKAESIPGAKDRVLDNLQDPGSGLLGNLGQVLVRMLLAAELGKSEEKSEVRRSTGGSDLIRRSRLRNQ
jgi:hypothetical protein